MICTGLYLLVQKQWLAGAIPFVSVLIVLGLYWWRQVQKWCTQENAARIALTGTMAAVAAAILMIYVVCPTNLLGRMNWPVSPVPLMMMLTFWWAISIAMLRSFDGDTAKEAE